MIKYEGFSCENSAVAHCRENPMGAGVPANEMKHTVPGGANSHAAQFACPASHDIYPIVNVSYYWNAVPYRSMLNGIVVYRITWYCIMSRVIIVYPVTVSWDVLHCAISLHSISCHFIAYVMALYHCMILAWYCITVCNKHMSCFICILHLACTHLSVMFDNRSTCSDFLIVAMRLSTSRSTKRTDSRLRNRGRHLCTSAHLACSGNLHLINYFATGYMSYHIIV